MRAIWFIALKMILFDNIMKYFGAKVGIAYGAHLSGYAFGIGAIFLALLTGKIKQDQANLVFMVSQWNRRRRYRGTVSDGSSPFAGSASRVKKVASKSKTSSAKSQAEPDNGTSEKIMNIRAEIARFIGVNNLSDAADLYLKILEIDPGHVLPRQHQLDMSNQLMSMGKWPESATAYEKFLTFYKSYEYIEQVELMLGILYSRYLSEPEKAIVHLKAAKERLSEASQIKMCQDELEKLGNN
jgi:tetratricopeptide (TPR) repeat protein